MKWYADAMETPSKSSGKWRNALVSFLGLKKNMVALFSMVILVGLGEKMAERFLPLYLIALGGGAFSVGLLNGMDNLLSALYSYPGGYLSDKIGYKKSLLLFNAAAITGYLIVIIFPYWQAVVVGAVFFLSWTAVSLPATMDMVSRVLPKNKRTMGVSMHSLMRRIPMALGPLLGGIMIGLFGTETGIRLAFAAALVLGGVSLILQQIMITEDTQKPRSPERNPLRAVTLINPALRNLLVSDILIRFCEQIPYAFVVLWCVTRNGITPLQFGALTTIEMVTAMIIYIPVAYAADKSTKKPFIVITFSFFTLFPPLLLFSRSFGLMVVAFIIRGLKEFGEPARKALIMDLAPEGKKAGTFGTYYLLRDSVVSLAAFGGAFLWNTSPKTNFLTAFIFGILGTVFFAVFGRDTRPS